MGKQIIAANWKMHGNIASVESWCLEMKSFADFSHATVVFFPPAIFIPLAQSILKDTDMLWGGQNCSEHAIGAFTGELSAAMLAEFHCDYVLVGHSERRAYFQESHQQIAQKVMEIQQHGIVPIICVGESLEARQQGKTALVIREQLNVVKGNTVGPFVIAYEPLWAIGTGEAATPEEAQKNHAMIREFLKEMHPAFATEVSILYGGSVSLDNAKALYAMPDIDGLLIGGASLDAKRFLAVIQSIT